MFGKQGNGGAGVVVGGTNGNKGNYNQLSLDDFSDDGSLENEANGDDSYRNNINGSSNNNSGHHSSMQRQQQLFAEQDAGLEMLAQSADRLGQLSMGIHEELGQQNKILDDMDNDLGEASEQLDMVTRKTKEFIDMAGGQQNCLIILSLTIVAIVLFLLVVYF